MSERILLGQLNPHQKKILAEAKLRGDMAVARAQEVTAVWKALVQMAFPAGANHFDEDTGCFYYAPPEPPVLPEDDPEPPAPPEDSLEQEAANYMELMPDGDPEPETDYEGSPDNAQVEGAEFGDE
jgi:hypothetical protein